MQTHNLPSLVATIAPTPAATATGRAAATNGETPFSRQLDQARQVHVKEPFAREPNEPGAPSPHNTRNAPAAPGARTAPPAPAPASAPSQNERSARPEPAARREAAAAARAAAQRKPEAPPRAKALGTDAGHHPASAAHGDGAAAADPQGTTAAPTEPLDAPVDLASAATNGLLALPGGMPEVLPEGRPEALLDALPNAPPNAPPDAAAQALLASLRMPVDAKPAGTEPALAHTGAAGVLGPDGTARMRPGGARDDNPGLAVGGPSGTRHEARSATSITSAEPGSGAWSQAQAQAQVAVQAGGAAMANEPRTAELAGPTDHTMGAAAVSGMPARDYQIGGAAETPPLTLATPATSPEFRSALGLQVSLLARNGVQQAELHLNPAEMGPVSIQIVLDGQHAQVNFGADSAQTRQLIEAGMPELASALREAGLTLTGGGVSQHNGGQRHGAHPNAAPGSTLANSGSGSAADDHSAVQAEQARRNPARGVLGGVDLYA